MRGKKASYWAKAPPGTNINGARDHIKALSLSQVLINALRGDAAYAPFLKSLYAATQLTEIKD